MKPSIIVLLIAALIISPGSNAQSDSTEKQKPQFKISLNYNSSLNYYGRTDSLKSTGVFPLAELWFNKDLYVNAAPVFVNNSSSSFEYAGTVASIGYMHVTDKLITNVFFTKPFYKQSSELVQSALKAQTGTSLSFLNKYLNITAGGDLKFSDEVDYGAMAGLDHLIRKEPNNRIVLIADPSVYAYAGTQNFTNTYLKKKPGFLLFPGGDQQVKKSVKKFNLLAYEVSLPLIIMKGKWMAVVTPSYVLPQNLVTVPNRPDLSEKGQNMFYATIGLKHSF